MNHDAVMGEAAGMGDIRTVSPDLIAGWAAQHLAGASSPELPRLTEVFRDILWTANRYVPSEGGSICLGDLPGAEADLFYVAAFGSSAGAIAGARLPVTAGITGRVYREGRATLLNDARQDRHFFASMDEISDFTTRSILAVPVVVGGGTVGVISLFNRLEADGFLPEDLKLIEVLGGYASNSLLNFAAADHHREISRRDDLTGLRNDRYFHQQLRVELETRERDGGDLSLLFMDLDRFKSVVDTHGHLVGSQVLAEVGRLIGRVGDRPGATLARYGGDEFVVILPGVGAAEAVEVAESIRRAIADTVFLAEPGEDGRPALGLRGQFSASIGVASYRDCPFAAGAPADWKVRQRDFIQIADQAMYRAKSLGRDRVCLG